MMAHVRGGEPKYLQERHLSDLDQLVPLHQEYVAIVRAVAAEKGVALCDLARQFEALPRADLVDSFWSDGIHFSDDGSERAGRLLFDCLEQNGLLDLLTR